MVIVPIAVTIIGATIAVFILLSRPGTAVPARAGADNCSIAPTQAEGLRLSASKPAPPAVMPLISREVPAYSSPNVQPDSSPQAANDNDFGSEYRSDGLPAWVAYDLSSVPSSRRHRVLAVYYNPSYAYNTLHGYHYNNLRTYSIDGNNAPGGGSPPVTGWKTLVSVRGNTLHSRQVVFNLQGHGWVRINVTEPDGSIQNSDAAFNQFDIYDLSRVRKPADDWIFYGDSITAGGMTTYPDSGVPSFAELIHQSDPRRWPVAENGGEPFDTSRDGLARLRGVFSLQGGTGYLSIFPGRYVALSYGMNDAGANTSRAAYYRNMSLLVRALIAAGKVPVVAKIGYTNNPTYNSRIPALNGEIGRLYRKYPKVVRGPDFWTFFSQHPGLIVVRDIHPTPQGYAAMRQVWADMMLTRVYHVQSVVLHSSTGLPSLHPSPAGC